MTDHSDSRGSRPIDPDLVASLALDAVDEADEAMILDEIAADVAVGEQLATLRVAASWLGHLAASPAPAELRDAVLTGIADRRHASLGDRPLPGPVEILTGQVDDFRALLHDLDDVDWAAPTRAGLTIHDLVAHLTAIEAYTGGLVGLAAVDVDPTDALDHMQMTRPTIERLRDVEPSTLRDEWSRLAGALVARLQLVDPARHVVFHGLDVSVRSLCTMRTFELWVHGDDILDAMSRPAAAVDPGRLYLMGQLAVRSIPLGLALAGGEPVDETVRFVLTGSSGGVWTQPLGEAPSGEPAAVIVADIEDFCRLVGQRIMPDELDADIRGDHELATRVLHAARVFAA